mmetsp:Transcript_47099/g.87487  ORF Transcript_47099/g.87487 Transcript_47099/m.87487 type:complete len:109 (-) Transcript_47099:15-341(-)
MSLSDVVSAGKESRGASDGEGYKFGDFSRGCLSNVTQKGESSSDINRAVKIGGYIIGAKVGLAVVGGPLGLVAGSLLGASALGKRKPKRRGAVAMELPRQLTTTQGCM